MRQTTFLATAKNNSDEQKNPSFTLIPLLMYTLVPFFPSLLLSDLVAGCPEYISLSAMYNESMQSLFALLLSNRLVLYFLATCPTMYAGWRASAGVDAVRSRAFGGPGSYY